MSDALNTLIEKYIGLQDKSVFLPNVDEQYKSQYVEATKQRLYDTIYDEVKAEVRDEALKEAEDIINKKAGLKRIDEFKKLMFDGFIVAVFVGLLVNQITDMIGFAKGSVSLSSIWPTVFITMGFLLICIVIFICLFATELYRLLKKGYGDETDTD